jgi:bifunctional non-homologous end joining protein LigD
MPDRMIFDLDPDPAVEWEHVVESAHQIRQFLEAGGLVSFVKTTGGKGLHLVVPLQRRHDWDEVKAFSNAVAEKIEELDPGRNDWNMSKAKRRGKIFLDYLRNGRGSTAIAAYSTRATPGAPVSVPLTWKELTPAIHSNNFTVRNLRECLRSPRWPLRCTCCEDHPDHPAGLGESLQAGDRGPESPPLSSSFARAR